MGIFSSYLKFIISLEGLESNVFKYIFINRATQSVKDIYNSSISAVHKLTVHCTVIV